MKPSERVGLLDSATPVLPVVAQCQLLKVARSTVYYRPVAADPDNLAMMRRIDELHLAYPFYGSRRVAGGVGGNLPETQHEPAASGSQGVPVSVAGPDHRPAEPGLVRGHHIYPDG